MSQHEITLKMVNHEVNVGIIIFRAQITLYIISSENNICNLRPRLRRSYYFKHHDGCRSWKKLLFQNVLHIFSITQEWRLQFTFKAGSGFVLKIKKTKQNRNHSTGPYISMQI